MPDDDFWHRHHVHKAAGIGLTSLIERGVERFLYVYDFGDDWRHEIFIESVGDGETDVRLPGVRRRRAAVPAGRTSAALPASCSSSRRRSIRSHEEHDEVVTWYGMPFDLVDIDERRCGRGLPRWPPAPGCIQEASTRKAARFDLTCVYVPRGRSIRSIVASGMLSVISAGADCSTTATRAAAGFVGALRGRRTSSRKDGTGRPE